MVKEDKEKKKVSSYERLPSKAKRIVNALVRGLIAEAKAGRPGKRIKVNGWIRDPSTYPQWFSNAIKWTRQRILDAEEAQKVGNKGKGFKDLMRLRDMAIEILTSGVHDPEWGYIPPDEEFLKAVGEKGKLWGALRKCWKGYRLAVAHRDKSKIRYYAEGIAKFRRALDLKDKMKFRKARLVQENGLLPVRRKRK